MTEQPNDDLHMKEWRREFRDHWRFMRLAIYKSNLLSRLIYSGEQLRTTPCPKHKGRWSGCVWDAQCECMCGSNVTGWLPNPDDPKAIAHAPKAEAIAKWRAEHPDRA